MNLLPGCREMARLLSDARDSGRTLGWRESAHLLMCDVCRRVREQFATLASAAGRAPTAGPALTDDAKERLRRALRG